MAADPTVKRNDSYGGVGIAISQGERTTVQVTVQQAVKLARDLLHEAGLMIGEDLNAFQKMYKQCNDITEIMEEERGRFADTVEELTQP